jgi:KipI family sensor histidine kinase inhibitor
MSKAINQVMTISDCGDSGILVEFSLEYTERSWKQTLYLTNCLKQASLHGVLSIIPAYASVFVQFNSLQISGIQLKKLMREMMDHFDVSKDLLSETQLYRVPVLFNEETGLDLPIVAEELGITEEQVIALFCSKKYTVICIASPAGVPLLDTPPFGKKVSRLETPRTHVPSGSIGLSASQANVYTLNSPGGWKIIGRTPISFVDLVHLPPISYKPGDSIEFFPVNEEEYKQYEGKSMEEMKVNGE